MKRLVMLSELLVDVPFCPFPCAAFGTAKTAPCIFIHNLKMRQICKLSLPNACILVLSKPDLSGEMQSYMGGDVPCIARSRPFWIRSRFRSPITLPRMRSGPLPWDERTGCFAIRRKVPKPAPLYTPWWKALRQMGLSRSLISSMFWYNCHTLGSPHLMKNWKPSCLGRPISSKNTRFQIPMLTKNAISTSGRPQTRGLPFSHYRTII